MIIGKTYSNETIVGDEKIINLKNEVDKDIESIVLGYGYTLETHFAITKDGYILTLHRVGSKKKSLRATNKNKKAVLLQHGLLDSSNTWVINTPKYSLGFILADLGYDVWLGNNRGNYHSNEHIEFNILDDRFWNFSYDEMALYDFPALIDKVLEVSGEKSLSFIAHSEGTTQAFAGLTMDSVIEQTKGKINKLIGLAPLTFVSQMRSPIFDILVKTDAADIVKALGFNKFLLTNSFLEHFLPGFCKYGKIKAGEKICYNIMELLCGPSKHVQEERMDIFLSFFPAGTSVKNMQKWSQSIKSGKFTKFDYGSKKQNLKHYGVEKAPEYDLSKFPTDISTTLFYGTEDALSTVKDVTKLLTHLPTNGNIEAFLLESISHVDLIWGDVPHDIILASLP